jgi:protein phosphatase 1 regulatory subunit 10
VKDAKADSSFFSKPKAKLPSFKKSSAAPTQGIATGSTQQTTKPQDNVAQPSSFNPFEDALRSLKRTSSPKVESKPASKAADSPPPSEPKVSRKGKRVSFAPDGELEQIKIIERAVYDDDPTEVSV